MRNDKTNAEALYLKEYFYLNENQTVLSLKKFNKMIKKLFLLPILCLGLLTIAQGQTTSAKKCDAKKACCASKAKATKKTAFVKKTTTAKAVGNTEAIVTVNGVCGMCKMRIERAAKSVEGVTSALWDTMDLKLRLSYDADKVDLTTIEKAVAAVGHDTEHVKATDEAYSNLHGCCKYERS